MKSIIKFLFGLYPAELPINTPVITEHELYEGILILGGIGSGKTTGPGDHICRQLLEAGFGVLWLSAKQDEAERCQRLCEQTGRADDLIMFSPEGNHRFNFLDYELNSPGGGAQAAKHLLSNLVEYASKSDPSKAQDSFWPMSASRLLYMCMATIYAAKGTCSVHDLYSMITSLPQDDAQLDTEEWKRSFCGKMIVEAIDNTSMEKMAFFLDYLMEELPMLDMRTKSNILAQVMNTVDPFMSGDLCHLVTEETTVTPSDIMAGKIVCINTPTLKYQESGKFINAIWKLSTQRAVLRTPEAERKPVAIIQDEGQEFLLKTTDAAVQATGRSAKLVSVVMTQTISQLIAILGSEHEANSLVSNFSNKIVCASNDPATCKLASELCGEKRDTMMGGGSSKEPYNPIDDMMGNLHSGISWSQQWRPCVPPHMFHSLAKGGEAYDFIVEGYLIQSGKKFQKCAWRQRF